VTRGGNSDNAGRAPSTMRALKSGTHHLGITCAIKTVVDAPFGPARLGRRETVSEWKGG
jgi:hypothetical protein